MKNIQHSTYIYIPRMNVKAGTRAISGATSTLWNLLPASFKLRRNVVLLRRRLKTCL